MKNYTITFSKENFILAIMSMGFKRCNNQRYSLKNIDVIISYNPFLICINNNTINNSKTLYTANSYKNAYKFIVGYYE